MADEIERIAIQALRTALKEKQAQIDEAKLHADRRQEEVSMYRDKVRQLKAEADDIQAAIEALKNG